MLNTIKELINNKLPCLAECGGFMYLGHHIDGYEMVNYPNKVREKFKEEIGIAENDQMALLARASDEKYTDIIIAARFPYDYGLSENDHRFDQPQ